MKVTKIIPITKTKLNLTPKHQADTCIFCGSRIKGIFYPTCSKPGCKGYSEFANEICEKCKVPRWQCSC